MTRNGFRCLAAIWLLSVAGRTLAQDSPPLRSFRHFEMDSGTAQGLWAEAGAQYDEQDANDVSRDTVNVFARLAYGSKHAEGGLILPYYDVSADQRAGGSEDFDGIGDIEIYGKSVPIRTELIDLGAGLDVSFPSGDEDEGLGTGELGFMPFATAAVHLGTVDARGHFGYRFFADRDEWEQFRYGFGLYAPLTDRVALRSEFNALMQKAAGPDIEPWTFEPGVDVLVPTGEGMGLLFRPTGIVGMSDDAVDWGVAGSLVLTWLPR